MPNRSILATRAAGVLLPVSALPSAGPIGDFGPAARQFIDWLHRAGQRFWQVLPLTIPDSHGSPYASPSSLAGNWLYINPEELQRQGLLPGSGGFNQHPTSAVRYRATKAQKWAIIRASCAYFERTATPRQRRAWNAFRQDQRWWLTDFTLYQAIKDRFRGQPWWRWPKHWRLPASARAHLDSRLRRRMDIHAYAQWLFWLQWQAIRVYAHRRGVTIIGDMPFYVQDDSVDVWAFRQLFDLRANGRPRVVSGVPPDNFNPRGQRWGSPIFRWASHRREHFAWWVGRCLRAAELYNLTRIDHFQGFAETFHIPSDARDGRRGAWIKTPGHELLRAIFRRLPAKRFIAEDVGHPEPDAEYLRRHYHLPAIRILTFAWNGLPHNMHHPKFLTTDCLYYTSTHDTNTIVGWWRQDAKWYEHLHVREEAGPIRLPLAEHMLRIVYASRAKVAMAAAQDVLGLGGPARLNRPGRRRGNWSWRLRPGQLSPARARLLRRLASTYHRL